MAGERPCRGAAIGITASTVRISAERVPEKAGKATGIAQELSRLPGHTSSAPLNVVAVPDAPHRRDHPRPSSDEHLWLATPGDAPHAR